ncbi:hypothetical protein GGF46_001464 [Coemansia sp. RSA 552]|nr:hypothetical protein GGF46_001464 [Coemansia sp. RSA 552]
MEPVTAAVESVAPEPAVAEIDASGTVRLEPAADVEATIARQIGQLWAQHENFAGLDGSDDEASPAAAGADEAPEELDAYGVQAQIHSQLTLAQSEVQVALDMVRLLLAARKRAAREAGAAQTAALTRHGDERQVTGFAARVGEAQDEVAVGGVPFPVGLVGSARVDPAGLAQQKRRKDELRFVLGAKHRQLGDAAAALQRSHERLAAVARSERRFWRAAFAVRARNWVVLHHRQLVPRAAGDRYFVRYGDGDAVAELLRPDDDSDDAVRLYVPTGQDRRRLCVGLTTASGPTVHVCRRAREAKAHGEPDTSGEPDTQSDHSPEADTLNATLQDARRVLFDRELYARLCREARVRELGSVRSATRGDTTRDVLAATLSRDNGRAERFEWSLESEEPGYSQAEASEPFAQWQARLLAGSALVLGTMHQRRVQSAAKAVRHGTARTALSADEALVLAPVLQCAQFARWQHILATGVRRACAAWQRIVDEPIEVISQLMRNHAVPRFVAAAEMRQGSEYSPNLACVVRLRFQGGTVMAFWLDSVGQLYFIKGYYPPPVNARPDDPSGSQGVQQQLINRVFRVVPLGGLGEFHDQLRRELQSLLLLRVAAALTRYGEDVGGPWHVHQSQMCVVGEWSCRNRRQRQVIGVGRWDDGDDAWNLALYFGPKHPSAFDAAADRVGGPWVACYPPPGAPGTGASPRGSRPFKEKLLDTLTAAF